MALLVLVHEALDDDGASTSCNEFRKASRLEADVLIFVIFGATKNSAGGKSKADAPIVTKDRRRQ